jgi:hypothetical protein
MTVLLFAERVRDESHGGKALKKLTKEELEAGTAKAVIVSYPTPQRGSAKESNKREGVNRFPNLRKVLARPDWLFMDTTVAVLIAAFVIGCPAVCGRSRAGRQMA